MSVHNPTKKCSLGPGLVFWAYAWTETYLNQNVIAFMRICS